jgi:outer membrane protein assembly complex protein YaeT
MEMKYASIVATILWFAAALPLFGADEVAREPARNTVRFLGTRSVPEAEIRRFLRQEVAELESSPLSPARLEDFAFYLTSYYRKHGYLDVEVAATASGARSADVTVREGMQLRVREVRFGGNRGIGSTELLQVLIGLTAEQLSKTGWPLDQPTLDDALQQVVALYASRGWLRCAVSLDRKPLKSGGLLLQVAVEEGPRSFVGGIVWYGDTVYPRAELVRVLRYGKGVPFDPGEPAAMERRLLDFYRGRGHFHAKVSVQTQGGDASGGSVPLDIIVEPGPVVRVGQIDVVGYERVPRSFFEARFKALQGQPYSTHGIADAYRELSRTGLTNSVRTKERPRGDETVDLTITISEAPAKDLAATLAFESYEGASLKGRITHRNAFRNGRPLSLEAGLSQRGLEASLGYSDPWFMDGPWSFRAKLFSGYREEVGFTGTTQGLRFEWSRSVAHRWEFGFFAEGTVVELSDTQLDRDLAQTLDYSQVLVGWSQTFDWRNNRLNPEAGWVAGTTMQFGIVDGTPSFGTVTGRVTYFQPLGKTLLALGLRAGKLFPITSAEEVPLDQRFFLGGSTTVRSFEERQLGPISRSGTPFGGDLYGVANIEWQFPVAPALYTALFVDAGLLQSALVEDGAESGEDLRFALGLGIRYKLPIGPLRLDYGVNPARRSGEPFGAFHFSFGFAF